MDSKDTVKINLKHLFTEHAQSDLTIRLIGLIGHRQWTNTSFIYNFRVFSKFEALVLRQNKQAKTNKYKWNVSCVGRNFWNINWKYPKDKSSPDTQTYCISMDTLIQRHIATNVVLNRVSVMIMNTKIYQEQPLTNWTQLSPLRNKITVDR